MLHFRCHHCFNILYLMNFFQCLVSWVSCSALLRYEVIMVYSTSGKMKRHNLHHHDHDDCLLKKLACKPVAEIRQTWRYKIYLQCNRPAKWLSFTINAVVMIAVNNNTRTHVFIILLKMQHQYNSQNTN